MSVCRVRYSEGQSAISAPASSAGAIIRVKGQQLAAVSRRSSANTTIVSPSFKCSRTVLFIAATA